MIRVNLRLTAEPEANWRRVQAVVNEACCPDPGEGWFAPGAA